MGIAYKAGVDDTRGSPGVRALEAMAALGASVVYHDPLVPEVSVAGRLLRSMPATPKTVQSCDLVVVFMRQKQVDWTSIITHASAVLDCCNALGRDDDKVVRL